MFAMNDGLNELKQAIEREGFFALNRKCAEDDALICVSGRREPHAIVGKSFQVWRRTNGEWVLATWTPNSYLVPNDQPIREICLDFLRIIGP